MSNSSEKQKFNREWEKQVGSKDYVIVNTLDELMTLDKQSENIITADGVYGSLVKYEQPVFQGLNVSAKIIHANSVEKGFWDRKKNLGEELMQITGELSEILEADKRGKHANIQIPVENYPTWEAWFEHNCKNTVEDEFADAFLRLVEFAEGMGIDLEKHVNLKHKYNKTRPKLHGKRY